jgi:hypothetical protein
LSIRPFYLRLLCCPPMLITPLFVRSSFLLKVIVLSKKITLSKKDGRTKNGVINIGGQHNNLR